MAAAAVVRAQWNPALAVVSQAKSVSVKPTAAGVATTTTATPVGSTTAAIAAAAGVAVVASSQHSSAKIKRSNRRSRFGEPLETTDFDDDNDICEALSNMDWFGAGSRVLNRISRGFSDSSMSIRSVSGVWSGRFTKFEGRRIDEDRAMVDGRCRILVRSRGYQNGNNLGSTGMRKCKISSMTLGSQACLQGEGMSRFRSGVSHDLSCNKSGRKAVVTCQLAGAAVPGDETNGINDYIPNFTDKSLPLRIRAICFYLWTLVVSVPLFFVMLALQPFVLLFDKHRRKAQHLVNRIWASLTISLFYKAEIIGLENLPSSDEGAVYVANHQSFLDIYTLFLLNRPFKFISKTSNFLIPIIGWSMYLTGHVPLERMDKRSQLQCLRQCIDLVKIGVSVLFFPEGTRTSDGKMAAFKKGAFNVASKGNVPVVPIALIGTGKLMPNGLESTLRPGKVKVIIHPRIQGGSADELCTKTRDVIAQSLLKYGMPVA